MGILTAEMKAAADDIRLCFVATASKDGMPNVSATSRYRVERTAVGRSLNGCTP
jgi:predicted pyridoxine 5'-phosphate oxidase superfamily flavin-nucleotide-binding protein